MTQQEALKPPSPFKCDCCGRPLDLKNDIDCVEMEMFKSRNIAEGHESEFSPVDKGTLHYCGECYNDLLGYYVKNFKGVKSKKRVEEYAEVFTPPYIVKDMCDIIPKEMWDNPFATFLEPSCGTGNFLDEILRRKFLHCSTYQEGLKALASITGIDIQQDNCDETKARLLRTYKRKFDEGEEEAKAILDKQIICGDSLKIQEKWRKDELCRNIGALANAMLEKVTVKPKPDKNGNIVSVIEWHDDCSVADYLKSAIETYNAMEILDNKVWGALNQILGHGLSGLRDWRQRNERREG